METIDTHIIAFGFCSDVVRMFSCSLKKVTTRTSNKQEGFGGEGSFYGTTVTSKMTLKSSGNTLLVFSRFESLDNTLPLPTAIYDTDSLIIFCLTGTGIM
jgi:hypothetical protein